MEGEPQREGAEGAEDVTFIDFKFDHNFDKNGLVYFLGTHNGQSAEFCNPTKSKITEVKMSSVYFGNTPSNLTSRSTGCYLSTGADPLPSWIELDLKGKRFQPTHYTMRAGSQCSCFLRNWVFEGRIGSTSTGEEGEWEILREHVNDPTLHQEPGAGREGWAIATWRLEPPPIRPYTSFRIRSTGKCSSGYHRVEICGLELYGKLWVKTSLFHRCVQLINEAFDKSDWKRLGNQKRLEREELRSRMRYRGKEVTLSGGKLVVVNDDGKEGDEPILPSALHSHFPFLNVNEDKGGRCY